MRKIKFRAWDKIKKRFILIDTNPNLDFVISTTGFLYSIEYNFGETYILPQTDTEISLYTGIKDSKGQEIYEGDILLSSNEHGIFLQLIGFGDSEKEFDNMLKGFKITKGYTLEKDYCEITEFNPFTQELIKKYNIPLADENLLMDGWWVIGNIYENPELLEGIKDEYK